MHTLIIAEREPGIGRMLRDPASRITLPPPMDRLGYRLAAWDNGSAEADMVVDPPGALGAVALQSAARVARAIYDFAELCIANDQLVDEVRIQVLFIFHRSHRRHARALVKAIRLLNNDPRWRKLPDRYRRALNARRIVLMSCESGIEMNPADAQRYTSFAHQFHDLRIASAVTFRLEKKPPPSRPAEFWDPFIYTLSTGNFVQGGTRLHPNKVSFAGFTNQAVQGSGDDEHVDTLPGQTYVESDSAGQVHKYEGANYAGSLDVPAGSSWDAVSDAF
jgi:hypothetical protein